MARALFVAISILLAVYLCSAEARPSSTRIPKSAVNEPPSNSCDEDLVTAKFLANGGDWKDAETHFNAAAKESQCRVEALLGVQKAQEQRGNDLLRTGQILESEREWTKAEDVYRAAAADPSIGQKTRFIAGERLRNILEKEAQKRKPLEWRNAVTEWIKGIAEALVFVLALVLLYSSFRSISKSRRTILIYPFAAPTDELKNGIDIHLRYARQLMQNPALSPAGQVPAALVENLLVFADEVEAIEDLEIAGSKIPFAALGRRFGEPRIQVRGGFDGVAPLARAYSVVRLRKRNTVIFIQRAIRIGVPAQQRVDLLDFAYDVIRRASSAYAHF